MTLEHIVTAFALLVALLGLVRARTLSRRIDRLTETCWELRYEHGQLRARLARMEGHTESEPIGTTPAPTPTTSFVPLTTLRRNS